jgi:bifunctional DNase/RNase
MVEMKIFGLALDEQSQVPILILKDLEEKRVLPIWIGAMEAMSISISLNKISMTRPLTHDLMINVLNAMDAKITKVCVVDLKEGTYYAEIYIEKDDEVYIIDSRPSDAIALAIRCNAKIFANETLLEDIEKQRCILYDTKCDIDNKCALHDKWQKPKCAIDNFFTQTTLADLNKLTTLAIHIE